MADPDPDREARITALYRLRWAHVIECATCRKLIRAGYDQLAVTSAGPCVRARWLERTLYEESRKESPESYQIDFDEFAEYMVRQLCDVLA